MPTRKNRAKNQMLQTAAKETREVIKDLEQVKIEAAAAANPNGEQPMVISTM